jgi:hypothetical protein
MSISVPSALGQAPKPPKVVTGERLAKSSSGYPPWARAEDAARWLRDEGEIRVKPTARLACTVFNVSYPRLKQGQARLSCDKHHVNGNGAAPALSDDVVERIVTEVGVERIWRVVEKLTQPELPLSPAGGVS